MATNSMGLSGTVYTPVAPRNEIAALAHLRANKKGKSYSLINGEPNWHNLLHLVDILGTLDAPNAHVIISALGAATVRLDPIVVNNPIEEVRECRNFVAHKSSATLSRVQSYAAYVFSTLSDHLRRKNAGVEAFHEWGDCMIAIAESAAQ
ncbi:hypothetical protein [Mycolicibacterium sp. XJ870]